MQFLATIEVRRLKTDGAQQQVNPFCCDCEILVLISKARNLAEADKESRKTCAARNRLSQPLYTKAIWF